MASRVETHRAGATPLPLPERAPPISAEQVIHGVEPGGLAREELGRIERPQREPVAVQGPVRELEAFPHQAEHDRVLAGVVAGAEGVEADLAPRSLADLPLPAVGIPVRPRADRVADALAQPQRGPAGGVLLE